MTAVEGVLVLQNRNGLHARPISKIVELTQGFRSRVMLTFQGRAADGRSIFDLMMLGAGPGAVLAFKVEGEDAPQMAAALQALIQGRFGEE